VNLEDVQDLSDDAEDDENRPPIFTGEQSKRVPLFVNEEWTPQNDYPLLEDKNRDIAYWADPSDVSKLVEFVKTKAR
jgi:hypothetical protein